jgi:hypothetical protein
MRWAYRCVKSAAMQAVENLGRSEPMSSQNAETRLAGQSRAGALKARAIHELRHFAILFLYLWVLFGLFVLEQTVVSRQNGLNILPHGLAIINALVLAKVMLVAENFELARWLKTRPAILSIFFESALCSALFICFHVLERLIVGLFHGVGLVASMPSFGGGGFLGFLIVALILFVSLLPFFAFKNVTRAIGSKRMMEILFHSPPLGGEKT